MAISYRKEDIIVKLETVETELECLYPKQLQALQKASIKKEVQ